jgi:hypothetical protein
MKKVLVVLMVLSMVSMANAALTISVNGTNDPPDTQINLLPSQSVIIDIQGNGMDLSPIVLYLVVTPGTSGNISAGGIVMGNLDVAKSEYSYTTDAGRLNLLSMMGYDVASGTALYVNAVSTLPVYNYDGKIADEIVFHCDAVGESLLTLLTPLWVITGYDDDYNEYGHFEATVWDTQQIHQIPEPITMALLGLGGLLLRRRK